MQTLFSRYLSMVIDTSHWEIVGRATKNGIKSKHCPLFSSSRSEFLLNTALFRPPLIVIGTLPL